MADRPLVSAIVIFLNGARFISEAITSVFEQTYDRWELLLVDDGSTDGSTEIARGYAERHPDRVYYLHHPGNQNHGMSASRNLGLKHAQGDFVAYLDADDVWLPGKLEKQVAIMRAQPQAAMVYGSSQYWFSWTGEKADLVRDYTPSLGVEPDRLVPPPTLLTLSLKSQARTPCPSDFLVRRKVANDVGGFEEQFRGKLSLFEDQAFLAKVFLRSHVFVTQECWDRYRRHPDSCVSIASRDGTKYSTGVLYFDWLEKYLRSQRVRDLELWTALRKKRFRYRHATLYSVLRRARQQVTQLQSMMRRLGKKTSPA